MTLTARALTPSERTVDLKCSEGDASPGIVVYQDRVLCTAHAAWTFGADVARLAVVSALDARKGEPRG